MSLSSPNADLSADQAHLIHSLHDRQLAEHAHIWTKGRGAILIDEQGHEFLDALAGLWNVLVGHGRTELATAAAAQMSQLAYASSYSGSTSRPAIQLAEKLAELCYPSIRHFFFASGGAEANEAAFKTARFYWKRLGHPDKYKIISRTWAYHGTTLAAMSATGISSYWPMFEPRTPGFLHIDSPYPYRFPPAAENDPRTPGQRAADLLEDCIVREGAETITAFIGEPVQGAGGVIVPPDDYWPRIRQICDRHKILLITDEVITGFGRTGDWFGLSRYGIEPDIVTFAKGLTSGYFPMGGVGFNKSVAEAINDSSGSQTWMQAYTYSGHPVGCAVALANLDILEKENLLERARHVGRKLQAGLQTLASHPHVGEVRGLGTLAAIELVAERATKAEFPPELKMGQRLHAATQARGMFTRLRGDIYNFAPCYVIDDAQLDNIVSILGDSLDAVFTKV